MRTNRRGQALLAMAWWLCAMLPAAASGPPAAPVDGPGHGSAGELLWRSESGWIPLPLLSVEVESTVSGLLSRGSVIQRFENPTGETIEALYVFPLPDGAAVDRMEMQIGDRRIRSEIREREQAQRTYEQARDGGRKAALVDQRTGNLFRTSVANVNPGETVTIRVEYLERIAWHDGSFNLRVPLTYTPRFRPPDAMRTANASAGVAAAPEAGFVTDARAMLPASSTAAPRATIRVHLDPGLPLVRLMSPSHAIHSEARDGRYELTTGEVATDRDFILHWVPALGARPRAAVYLEPREGATYALILLVPPIPDSDAGLGLPTDTLFVIDVSGSMEGPSIRQAREALLAALDRLRPEDRFNLLAFNDGQQSFRNEFVHAEDAELAAARDWVLRLRADGGTMIEPALLRAVEMLGESRGSGAQRLVFVTDGAVSNEDSLLQAVTQRLGDARLHTLGVGYAPNGYLMRRLAERGHGLCEFVASAGETRNRIDSFFARLERPVLTDVRLTWNGVEQDEVYPRQLPDLHAGEPLIVAARLRGEPTGGRLTVGGWTREGWVETSVALAGRTANDAGVATHWARAKTDALMDGLHEGADPEQVRREVVDVALAFDLVTRYTSLVAVEQRRTADGPALTTRVPGVLPAGGTDRRARALIGAIATGLGLALLLLRARRPS